jgi:HJR/Mrr/RecB family endonuclease
MFWKFNHIFSNTKAKLLIFAVLAVTGIILFIISGNITKQDVTATTEEVKTKNYTAEELKIKMPNEIDTILFSFGIIKEWINDNPAKNKNDTQNDALWFNKEILIPYDLPLASVNYELKSFLKSVNFAETVYEDPRSKNLSVDIYHSADSAKKPLAKLSLLYSDKINRTASDVAIILNNVDKLNASDFEKIVSSPEKFTVVLPVNFENADIQSQVLETGRDFVLIYDVGNQDIPESDFRNDMSEKQWKGKVRSVTIEYPNTSGIFLNNISKDVNFEEDLAVHFNKYSKVLYKDTVLVKFTTKETEERKIYDLFSQILTNTNRGIKSQVYLVEFDVNDFNNYIREVNNLRKRGYRFLTFKEIMKQKDSKQK